MKNKLNLDYVVKNGFAKVVTHPLPFRSWHEDSTHLPVVTEDLLDVGHLAQAEPLLVQATAAQKI
jgi:hypothetical protein